MPRKRSPNKKNYTAQEAGRLVQQARRTLLSNVTYELLTPLTTIRFLAETLQDNMVKDEKTQHSYYQNIISETKRMEQLICDLMELSKLQGDCPSFEKKSVRTIDVFGPVLERHLMRYADTETALNIENLSLDGIPLLQTNAEKLVRLVSILLDNAVTFAGHGGTVSIGNEVSPQHITFCIRANGPDTPDLDANDLFHGFYQAAPECHTANKLEFAIAEQIASGLHENLWAESSSENGIAFFFTVTL